MPHKVARQIPVEIPKEICEYYHKPKYPQGYGYGKGHGGHGYGEFDEKFMLMDCPIWRLFGSNPVKYGQLRTKFQNCIRTFPELH